MKNSFVCFLILFVFETYLHKFVDGAHTNTRRNFRICDNNNHSNRNNHMTIINTHAYKNICLNVERGSKFSRFAITYLMMINKCRRQIEYQRWITVIFYFNAAHSLIFIHFVTLLPIASFHCVPFLFLVPPPVSSFLPHLCSIQQYSALFMRTNLIINIICSESKA